jgi:hypothetical protein
MLDFKQPIAVLVDEEKQEIIFAVDTPSSKLTVDSQNKLDIAELSLTTPMNIRHEKNTVHIQLK